ncbi:hypothetical protein [Tropicimonas isoalkanivorans]|uniref:Uncharacterized protein n=1 Tax=Tropicimonas isoalkanivorans TaxID=441112 RepID=A0A1I1PBU1_9RHOB|nr:hypothetical protein [Tropicimonas isoalkanivorans]SFD07176.1 hypothetical protein SAMN04488094_114108 [Tropicimonas isoalkanivorans]
MSDREVHVDIGQSLCRVCGTARFRGNRRTMQLAQTALRAAFAEIGGLPQETSCPHGGPDEPGCPMLTGYSGRD